MITNSVHEDLSAIEKKLEQFCAYQERSMYDVAQKLQSLKVTAENARLIINHLVVNKYLDEERFARTFVRGKFHINKWGKVKIIGELRRRNVSEVIISQAIREIGHEDYLRTIRDLIWKKQLEISLKNNLMVREKIITFVTGKGFEFHLVEKILTELNITNDRT